MTSRIFGWGLVAALVCLPLAAEADLADTTAMDWSRVPEYRVVPGDLLRFNFGPAQNTYGDLIRESRVRPDGRVSVYPVGDVIAAGRTIPELQQAVVDMMSSEYRFPSKHEAAHRCFPTSHESHRSTTNCEQVTVTHDIDAR